MDVPFGFWPRDWTLSTADLVIAPQSGFAEIVATMSAHARHHDGWIYPPLVLLRSQNGTPGSPLQVPAAVFALPATHTLTVSTNSDDDYADYALAVLGLAEGLRIVRDGWTHFHKASIRSNALNDVVCTREEIEFILGRAQEWWMHAPSEARSRMFGAIHWHLFASGYEHEFEEFSARYTVLDTLHYVHHVLTGDDIGSHAARPASLAQAYKVAEPNWASLDGKSCALSRLRNELVHEARFAGAPIGFAYPDYTPYLSLQLRDFTSRLILAMLKVRCGYVRSSATTGQLHALDLDAA